jgi:general secretion pathway protein M
VNEFWSRLNQRQQVLLVVAALTVVGAVLFTAVWEPMIEVREQRRDQVAAQQALSRWLDAVAPMASQLRQRAAQQQADAPRSLLGLADETARAAGLAGSLSRIEPAGEDRVRVWLEQAEFVATMQWLGGLASAHPVSVSQLNLERAGASGQVNVRVTLLADG